MLRHKWHFDQDLAIAQSAAIVELRSLKRLETAVNSVIQNIPGLPIQVFHGLSNKVFRLIYQIPAPLHTCIGLLLRRLFKTEFVDCRTSIVISCGCMSSVSMATVLCYAKATGFGNLFSGST